MNVESIDGVAAETDLTKVMSWNAPEKEHSLQNTEYIPSNQQLTYIISFMTLCKHLSYIE